MNYEINNLNDYSNSIKKYVEIYAESIFLRGESSKYIYPTSSIARQIKYVENEGHINQEVLSITPEDFKRDQSEFEKLVRMQHYGIPTRLIDVTFNPLVALFFAVQSDDNEKDGYVYLYIEENSVSYKDKEVDILSKIAFSNVQSINSFKIENNLEESEEQLARIINQNYFINDTPIDNNDRISRQKGTFVICGNEINNSELTDKIIPLDCVPTRTFRIPYEYKESIKNELDSLGYNIYNLYVDLPSVANYIKSKYKETSSIEGAYEIIEHTSQQEFKHVWHDITILLKKKLKESQIRKIIKKEINNISLTKHIIYVYVAEDQTALAQSNWICQCRWGNEKLEHNNVPSWISDVDSHGYLWGFSKTKISNDYYKSLEAPKRIVIAQLQEVFIKIERVLKSFNFTELIVQEDKSASEARQQLEAIRELFHDRVSLTHDLEVSEVKQELSEVEGLCTNYFLLYDRGKWSIGEMKLASRYGEEAHDKMLKLESVLDKLARECPIEDEDLIWSEEQSEIFSSVQTLPISTDAHKIHMSVEVEFSTEKIYFEGVTTLFDGFKILITCVCSDKNYKAADNVIVQNGKITTRFYPGKQKQFEKGLYKFEVIGGIPAVQSLEVQKKTGIEYEKIRGEIVEHQGSSSMIKYEVELELGLY
ncbi:FRG domain-containing protein [Sporosarcina cascadiensis]|uniref:FRG domain-containing protein n=1 Tax=Sporosarcina cascadiensis TaxID=2660747 RepID=UPI00129B9A3A|nr:FRG domain-containing protein [Sporosarcina cascadiensis]